jgi:hypothetical protein
MAEVIDTAGLAEPVATADPRKEAVKAIRAVLRKADATDEEYEDALEALAEMARS